MSPMTGQPTMPVMIQLVPGENDTMESWFKVGGADAIADRLIADGHTKPCILTTSNLVILCMASMASVFPCSAFFRCSLMMVAEVRERPVK